MFTFLASFKVPAAQRDEFVALSLKTGADSLSNEPGTLVFEVIADESDQNLFHFHEGYADAEALNVHMQGNYFGAWYEAISGYAEGPTWLMKGTLVEQPAA
jgi:autoinducer 2-degrading protein